jgi:light-regulated signal transduction histidine kinase (bacteriophytochrome)
VQKGRRLGTLFLKYDTGSILWEWVKSSAGTAGAVLIGVLVFAYLLSRALERRISAPILALAATAKSVAERKDYAVRAVKAGNDELGLLTDAFNQMLDQIISLNQDLETRVEQRTAQLATANRELEAFSYSVSHDLRAPLRHVDGFATMLRKHAQATLDDKGRRYLNTISDSAKKMGQLIDDLLAFSRIGRAQLAKAEVDQDSLVAGVVRDGHYEDGERKIAWTIGRLPPVQADPALLRQVWSNLIGNAVKYSGKAAQPQVTVTGVRTPEECIFSVADNGVGFDMAYAHKLFGVFQRLHGVADFEGTGIGLANVRRIVTRHGGRTWAEGKVGAGATFYFSLPHAPAAPPASTHEHVQVPLTSDPAR